MIACIKLLKQPDLLQQFFCHYIFNKRKSDANGTYLPVKFLIRTSTLWYFSSTATRAIIKTNESKTVGTQPGLRIAHRKKHPNAQHRTTKNDDFRNFQMVQKKKSEKSGCKSKKGNTDVTKSFDTIITNPSFYCICNPSSYDLSLRYLSVCPRVSLPFDMYRQLLTDVAMSNSFFRHDYPKGNVQISRENYL